MRRITYPQKHRSRKKRPLLDALLSGKAWLGRMCDQQDGEKIMCNLCLHIYNHLLVCNLNRGSNMKNKHIHIRVTAEQHAAIMKAARKAGMTVSAYILLQAGVK
jgi:hypothetical protein